MKKRIRTSGFVFLAVLVVAFLIAPGLFAGMNSQGEAMEAQEYEAPTARRLTGDETVTVGGKPNVVDFGAELPRIDATLRISIPYGFQSSLPLVDDGTGILASGHGGCTEGELVTVAVTITQSTSGAVAMGQTEQTCSGELQHWSLTATVDTPPAFTEGAAQACGLATTYAAGYVTDTYGWCVDVEVAQLDHQVFLPLAVRQ